MQKPQPDFETVLDSMTAPADSFAAPAPFPIDRLQLDLVDRMKEIEAEWRRLEALPCNSLHHAYDWCHAWHQAHRNPLLLVRGRINGRTVMILPLEAVRENGATIARFIAIRFNNFNTGLLDGDFRFLDGEALQALRVKLATLLKGKADLVTLGTMPLFWRDIAHPFTGLYAIEDANHTFQMPLLSSFEQALAQVNAKRRRKKFRVQERRLLERGGYEHVIATTDREKQDILSLFFQQKAARFKQHGLPDVFRPAEIKAFFGNLIAVQPNGHDIPLELHAIRLKGKDDGKIAAISGLSRKGDHVICQFGSIDDTLAPEASPGELLFWLMIKRASEQGVAIFDFGIGDQLYKRSWCTVETVTHQLLLPITVRGWLMMLMLAARTRAKVAIKKRPPLYRFIQKIRRRGQAPQPAPVEND